MGEHEAIQLQHQIDQRLSHPAPGEDLRIALDQGSDVTDLTANVDVRVSTHGGPSRYFTIVTARCLHEMLGDDQLEPAVPDAAWDRPSEWRGLFSTGSPLVVVREITADVIVRAVQRYLVQEDWEAGRARDSAT